MINLDRIYRYRFEGVSNEVKKAVWKEISSFLYNEMNSPERVLDPAAGFCEFINNIPAVERWAVDQNSQFLKKYAHKNVHKISGNCLDAEIPLEYFDVVFVSNFLEHLNDSEEVFEFLRKAYQWLKPAGLLVVMGPNFKYCSKDYFDCSDHKVILTDISLCELGYSADFEIKKSYSKFLPYSFRSRLPKNPILVKNYLKFPFIWSILGKQFLVFFQKRYMNLSVIIPAYNEVDCIADTIIDLHEKLEREEILFEIVVVNDNSDDGSGELLDNLSKSNPNIRTIDNIPPNGFGFAVRRGLEAVKGEYVVVVMADASDNPDDVVRFFHLAEQEGVDAVFGNRFIKGGSCVNYPFVKLCLNRFTNWMIAMLFAIRYTDTTNAFKLYRQDALDGLKPYLSHHFNLTVELPLKLIVRGYSYRVLPNSWTNRKSGVSKLKIKEMGSRYWFIIFYCLIEKWLSVGDYKK